MYQNLDLYVIGMIIDCVAIVLIAANAIRDKMNSPNGAEYNVPINTIGAGLVVLVVLSLIFRSEGWLIASNVLVGASAIPVLACSAFMILLILIDSGRH
ncbi:hypothetical protein [Dyadobacter sandarakinus]|uniref:Uncharacterized protein n=1 Tax=Dyadobacter sandarakinus TaxID=2747268 RepID=A0ABX7I139_9BACT|nr:hypothetical protein [Dyadobacter sandarakinus]QRQ99549.1 hypothetical protein HWI92_00780 [Dyadobacter sandarakinus]